MARNTRAGTSLRLTPLLRIERTAQPLSQVIRGYGTGNAVMLVAMKKTYPASKKARSRVAYNVHLRPKGKRAVNKSTRQAFKAVDHSADTP